MPDPSSSTTRASNIALIAGCGAALATLVPVALHQFGALSHLPDPPGAIFKSDRITESKMAHPLGVPDSVPGLVSYAATLVLASLVASKSGVGKDGAILEELLGAKLVLDGSAAAFNAVRQVVHFRKLCSWCTGTVLCTGVMLFAGRRHVAASIKTASAQARRLR